MEQTVIRLLMVKKFISLKQKILRLQNSINNLECKARLQIVNVNGNHPVFFPFSIKTSESNGSCNCINNPHAKLYVSDVVKSLNVKVFNLISRTNETRHIEQHKTFRCRLDTSVFNNKQRWNEDKCRCEYKELIDKGLCDKSFIWNPNNCECECDKSYDVAEYLNCESCRCRKELVEQCTETNEEVKLAKITLAENENKHKCSFSTLYIVLFSIIFTINVGIGTYFLYFYCYLKKDVTRVNFGTRIQTTI